MDYPHCHPVTYGDRDEHGAPRDTVVTAVEDQQPQCASTTCLMEYSGSGSGAVVAGDERQRVRRAGGVSAMHVRAAGTPRPRRTAAGDAVRGARGLLGELMQLNSGLSECVCDARVEPFFVAEHAGVPFGQLSDHYGVSAKLTLPPMPRPPTPV